MSQQPDTFFRELEEEVRRDKLAKFFDKYGVAILAAVLMIGAVVGGYYWYRAVQLDTAQKAGARFAAAERLLANESDSDRATAISDLETIARDAPGGFSTLARLRLAGVKLEDGDREAALALFSEVASDPRADARFRDFARLKQISLDSSAVDWTELKNRLTPLMVAGATWRYSARELLALKAIESGAVDDARQLLGELLADAEAPGGVRSRAELMMTLITVAPGRELPETQESPAQPRAEGNDDADTKSPESAGNTTTNEREGQGPIEGQAPNQ